MSKVVDVLFSIAIALGVMMLAVCMMMLPDSAPPVWVAYAVLAAMAACIGMACAIGFSASTKAYKEHM